MNYNRNPIMSKDGTERIEVALMRQQLENIFEHGNWLFLTGDNIWPIISMIGLWKEKPIYNENTGEFDTFDHDMTNQLFIYDKVLQDTPWCIDLCSGEMELPSLGLKLTLEEWAVM